METRELPVAGQMVSLEISEISLFTLKPLFKAITVVASAFSSTGFEWRKQWICFPALMYSSLGSD